MRFLVAIPVFNEERHVSRVLPQVLRLVDDVLVVDDGSTDAAAAELARFPTVAVIRHAENRGYGQSLIDAFAYASRHDYDWVITLDCDDQHEPARLPAFIERAEQDDVDIVSGSRYLMEMPGNTSVPADRRKINLVITRVLNRVLGLSLTDSFCGFKAYRVAALDRLALTVPGYAFPLQFWVQAVDRGLRICELPVRLIYNDPTRHFGGLLDNPASRLQHYLEIFIHELERTRGREAVAEADAGPGTRCGGCCV